MIVLDVDGVLTDGSIIVGSDGGEYKRFNVHDGYGITRAHQRGMKFAIISGRESKVTTIRAERLKITEVYQGSEDKLTVFQNIKAKFNLDYADVCFMGDDEFDLPLLKKVGVSFAPADAVERVCREVDYVTKLSGGRGAVREIIDMILTEKNLL